METNAVCLKLEEKNLVAALQEACAQLGTAEVVLDFSAIRRIDTNALRALEQLARTSEDKSAKVTLCGVNVEVYKVLKLAKLAPRFTFTT